MILRRFKWTVILKVREDLLVHHCCAVWGKADLISGDIYSSYLYAYKHDLRSLLRSGQLNVWLIKRVFGEWQNRKFAAG